MASLRKLQYRQEKNADKLKRFACIPALLSVLDGYTLQTTDAGGVRIFADVNVFSEQIEAGDLFELTGKLFAWLGTLPKEIWAAKEKELEVLL